jgi:hypothetical protein
MKIRRLSEIDLARIAPLETDEKRYRLRLLKAGRPPHTYNPFRASLGDILNLQPEMFEIGGKYTPWSQISADIKKRAKSDDERKFNLAVAEALYEFGIDQDVRSHRKLIAPWNRRGECLFASDSLNLVKVIHKLVSRQCSFNGDCFDLNNPVLI